MQSPASDRTVFSHHHDSHILATCTPSCIDSRRRCYKYQAHGFRHCQWLQANLAYIDCPIGCAQCVVVRLSSSTEAQSCAITFSSKTHSVLGDPSGAKIRINACRSGPRPDFCLLFETASTWLIVFSLLQDVPRVTTYTPPYYPKPCS